MVASLIILFLSNQKKTSFQVLTLINESLNKENPEAYKIIIENGCKFHKFSKNVKKFLKFKKIYL